MRLAYHGWRVDLRWCRPYRHHDWRGHDYTTEALDASAAAAKVVLDEVMA